MNQISRILLAAACALLLTGQGALAADGGTHPAWFLQNATAQLVANSPLTISSLRAGDALHLVMRGRVSRQSLVLVTTMVQLNDLEKTSTLGRTVMQQVGSRLSQYGYRIAESRLAQNLTMRPHEGEFMLSREIARLMEAQYNAQAVLVGTYVESPSTVYISLRVIRLDDNAVVAAYEYDLPNKGEVRALLREKRKTVAKRVDSGGEWASFVDRPTAYAPKGGIALPPVQSSVAAEGTSAAISSRSTPERAASGISAPALSGSVPPEQGEVVRSGSGVSASVPALSPQSDATGPSSSAIPAPPSLTGPRATDVGSPSTGADADGAGIPQLIPSE